MPVHAWHLAAAHARRCVKHREAARTKATKCQSRGTCGLSLTVFEAPIRHVVHVLLMQELDLDPIMHPRTANNAGWCRPNGTPQLPARLLPDLCPWTCFRPPLRDSL